MSKSKGTIVNISYACKGYRNELYTTIELKHYHVDMKFFEIHNNLPRIYTSYVFIKIEYYML